jgi:hypothetical protein
MKETWGKNPWEKKCILKVITDCLYSWCLAYHAIICYNCGPQIGSLAMAASDDLLNTHFIAQHHWTMDGIHLLFTQFPPCSILCHKSLAVTWQKVGCIEITPWTLWWIHSLLYEISILTSLETDQKSCGTVQQTSNEMIFICILQVLITFL